MLRRALSTTARRSITQDGHRLVLGIESSCDDSCASLVSAPVDYFRGNHHGAVIHNSIVLKQDHGLTKGIEPMNAANAHSARLPLAIHHSLSRGLQDGILSSISPPAEIDAIAVTRGPGMAGCLSQGLSNAKLLSTLWDRPLIYVHHMIAHTLTPFLTAEAPKKMPFLVLLLSGGHTQMVLCKSPIELKILATSNDDSIGDAFDKVARLLQIDFNWSDTSPGAALENFASSEGSELFSLPVPFRKRPEFSYSGLKSALMRFIEKDKGILPSERQRRALAYAFQQAAFAQIQDKIAMAFDRESKAAFDINFNKDEIQDLVISGGVASNSFLRQCVQNTLQAINRQDINVHFPPVSLCTDNAAMIAHAGLISWNTTRDLTATPRAKWSVEAYPCD